MALASVDFPEPSLVRQDSWLKGTKHYQKLACDATGHNHHRTRVISGPEEWNPKLIQNIHVGRLVFRTRYIVRYSTIVLLWKEGG